VVNLALSKYPNERQQSARELVEGYGRALGFDFWAATAPVDWQPRVVEAAPAPLAGPSPLRQPADPFHVLQEFEAFMPERLAAAKLRGFVEDCKGTVLESEPGLIRMRIGLPDGYKETTAGSGLFGWFTARRPSVPHGQEPIEVELHMEKPDPSQPRLHVVVAFRPIKDYPPKNQYHWQERCDKLHSMLRQYLGT
jgi:hypothetical protein